MSKSVKTLASQAPSQPPLQAQQQSRMQAPRKNVSVCHWRVKTIVPRVLAQHAMENVGYDPSALGLWHWAVVTAGTWAEFILPLTILIGLFTRLSALGMIGFIIVQSLTDLYGHGLAGDAKFIGGWFDRIPDTMLIDQRLLWVFPLIALVIKGAGALSIDRALLR